MNDDVGNKVPYSLPPDGRSWAPLNTNSAPEVTVLPMLTIYINLILSAGEGVGVLIWVNRVESHMVSENV